MLPKQYESFAKQHRIRYVHVREYPLAGTGAVCVCFHEVDIYRRRSESCVSSISNALLGANNAVRTFIYDKSVKDRYDCRLNEIFKDFRYADLQNSHIILNGLVAKSPVSTTLKLNGKKAVEKEPLTAADCNLLLERVKNLRAKTFLLIALHTGMRRGEILGLQWDDVDFKSRMIHIRHNAVITEHETTVNDFLKTAAGRRDVPLTDELEQWLAAQKKLTHSKYVIAMENHKPLTKSSYRSLWRLIERELPEKHITAHILRHTYITRLFEAGLDVKEVQYLAGHSTMDMTLKVYTHYDRRSRQAKTAEKVREALRLSA